jgi:hypothetical protein
MASELLNGFDTKVDIYSAGMIFYFLIHGVLPFNDPVELMQ